MTLPLALPDWLPWWASLAILLPLALFALAFLAMPFSVLGLKGRMEAIEGRLDEIQGEIRALALRLPESARLGREPARDLARAKPTAESEPPTLPSLAERRGMTDIPPLPPRTQPAPPLVVPIPPSSLDLAAAPRRFVPPVTRAEVRGRGDPAAPQPGGRSEPRIDWPR